MAYSAHVTHNRRLSKFSGGVFKSGLRGACEPNPFLGPLKRTVLEQFKSVDFSLQGPVGLTFNLLNRKVSGEDQKRAILGNLAFCTLSDPPEGPNPGFGLILGHFSDTLCNVPRNYRKSSLFEHFLVQNPRQF